MSIWVHLPSSSPYPSPQTHRTHLSGRILCVHHLLHPTLPLKHVEHTRLGVFYVFTVSSTLSFPSNTYNMPVWVYSKCSPAPPPCPSPQTCRTHLSGCVLCILCLSHPALPLRHVNMPVWVCFMSYHPQPPKNKHKASFLEGRLFTVFDVTRRVL
jgi:hypothetical protein